MSEQKSNMEQYQERVKKYLPGGVHYNFNFPWEETPIHFQNTKKSRLWDMNGWEYLDLYARFWAMILGHGKEEYTGALKDPMDRVLLVSHCDLDAEVLELIASYISNVELIRFGVSGTEMVRNALRLARAYTGKDKFIRFENHYHGSADNIMGGKAKNKADPYPEDYQGNMKGIAGRARYCMERQSFLLPPNDLEAVKELVSGRGNEIAELITEPVCVNGGSEGLQTSGHKSLSVYRRTGPDRAF